MTVQCRVVVNEDLADWSSRRPRERGSSPPLEVAGLSFEESIRAVEARILSANSWRLHL